MNAPRQTIQDKTCLITGGNDGIGKETAVALARQGAHIVIVSRNAQRGRAAQDEIRARSGNPRVEVLEADLASQAAIHQLAQTFKARHSHLHVLINNAGAIQPVRTLTPDGLETTFAVNHLAPFLLTHLLLDVLLASRPARIINVTSLGHKFARLDLKNLQGERQYAENAAYGQSKLAALLFTFELARRLSGTGVTVNAADPGFVDTKMPRSTGSFFAKLRFLMVSPEQGAQASVRLASAPELAGVTGRYFTRKGEARASKTAHDERLALQLWSRSEELVGLEPTLPAEWAVARQAQSPAVEALTLFQPNASAIRKEGAEG